MAVNDVERYAVEGVVVETDAYHPMSFAGTCLSCGRSEMSSGCAPSNLGERLRALRQRGVCEYVVDLLRDASPADLREVEGLSVQQVSELNAVVDERQSVR